MNVEVFAADENPAYFTMRVNKRLAGHVEELFQSPRRVGRHVPPGNFWK